MKPIPRKRLTRIQNTAQSLNELLDTIKSSEDDAHSLLGGISGENRYLKQANLVEQEFNVMLERTGDSSEKILELKDKLSMVRQKLNEQNRVVDGKSPL
jgi:hypothetical protein